MAITVDDTQFAKAHESFCRHVAAKAGGVEFDPGLGFQHPFLVEDEISYKWKIYRAGKDALSTDRWSSWKNTPGKIIDAAKVACTPQVSGNLLEQRYGPERGPMAPFYLVDPDDAETLEDLLHKFFICASPGGGDFARSFDHLAEFLRQRRLKCHWALFAYLAFLAAPHRYFPILPTRFDELLRFYGNNERVSGKVAWVRYQYLLDLADALREKLLFYGRASAVEIQSYMWVVAYLLRDAQLEGGTGGSVTFEEELTRRQNAAFDRERIGLLGEKYVIDLERRELNGRGLNGMAAKVRLVAAEDSGAGFDVLSFHLDGSEKRIEVKSTTRTPSTDAGFWLSENERRRASEDPSWTVYRVWNVVDEPTHEDLGNVVRDGSQNWRLSPSTWWVEPIAS